MDLSYILNHLGEDRAQYFGAVAPPLVQSSIFAFPNVAAMRDAFADEYGRHLYTRGNNPTVEILRRKVAALEGAEDCLMFGSGAAAMAAGVMTHLVAGDHVVCVAKPYSWTRTLLRDLLGRYGVAVSFVDGCEVAYFEAALRERTRLIVLESPNSLTFEQQDLAAVAALAQARGIRTICDNSYATPLNQSPLALGIDLVVHSATKYLNGHSDVVAGALCGSSALLREVFRGPYMALGAILSPHDAWLLLRGLRTLAVRVERINANALTLARWLEAQPQVERVHYPGLESHPQHALARRQMKGGGPVIAFAVKGGYEATSRFVAALELPTHAVSLGGVESLIVHTAAMWAGTMNEAQMKAAGIPPNFVRFSVGLEHPDDLKRDLANALAEAAR